MNTQLLTLVCAGTLALSACETDDPESANNDVTSPTLRSISAVDQVLLADEAITVEFSEAVDPGSLQLNHGAFNINQVSVSANSSNTVFTLTPNDVWPGGDVQFTVQADDLAGNASEPKTFSATINLSFDNFAFADIEIGQSEVEGTLTPFLFEPYGSHLVHEDQFWVADYDQSTLHIFNTLPTQSNTAPDAQVATIESINDQGEVVSHPLSGANDPVVFNNQMSLVLFDANQVVIFDEIPTPGQNNFGIVLGQTHFTDIGAACSATGFDEPETAFVVDGKLLVADDDNNRVLIWNTVPTESGTPADIVLGQNSFNTCVSNDDDQDEIEDERPSARTLSGPSGIWSDGEKLIVTDTNNSRLLIWNTFPTESFAQADRVMGQPDFASRVRNNDIDELGEKTASARTLRLPFESVVSNGRQIIVSDTSNERILIWNDWPTEDFVPADALLGQSDFAFTQNNDDDQNGITDNKELEEGEEPAAPSLRVLDEPSGLAIHNNQLIASDVSNSRVLIFNSK